MPFEIVRNDIVNMQTDAIVNTASPKPVVGYGVDAAINQKAGKALLEAREKIGTVPFGSCAITPGFNLDAKYVIHAVGPLWQGGEMGERELLHRCYTSALNLALENNCESIAFPLLCGGNHGFPKSIAMEIAIDAISKFLMKEDMQIYLVVFSRDALSLSEKLFTSVAKYNDDRYIGEKTFEEYGVADKCNVREFQQKMLMRQWEVLDDAKFYGTMAPLPAHTEDFSESFVTLDDKLKNIDAGFSESLLKLIDRTGKKDSDIYKKANVDRKLFSKIRNNPAYKPSKSTAIAFAIVLELTLDETEEFIARAGYALTHSSKFDIIIEYFIENGIYDIFKINETLFAFDQNLLGA